MSAAGRSLDDAIGAWEAGEVARAATLCRELMDADPTSPAALRLMGDIALASGHTGAALALLVESLRHSPGEAGVLAGLAVALRRLGHREPGERAVRAALIIDPNSPEALYAAARAAMERGAWSEAATRFEHLLALRPETHTWRFEFADALIRAGRQGEAVPLLQALISGDPDNWRAMSNLGVALKGAGRVEEAIAVYRRALALAPEQPHVLANLATLLLTRADGGCEAISLLHRAIHACPHDVDVWLNLGQALRRTGRIVEAEGYCRETLRHLPDHVEAHVLLAMILLQRGDWTEGFAEYEWRNRLDGFARDSGQPQWCGGALAGQTVLLHAEQGLGDAIQFIRYAPFLQRAGARVIVACDPLLARLFSGISEIAVVYPDRSPPSHDAQVPLMSLPLRMGMTEPAATETPYLRAEPSLIASWRKRVVSPGGDTLRVGLVWAGGAAFRGDAERSLRFDEMRPLVEALPKARFFGLQVGDGRRDLDAPTGALPANFTDLGEAIEDFADTAAIMMSLDLVISCDTSSAHLAGALGCPVWTLIPPFGDWRWGEIGERTPWYATMRLFRRAAGEDWPAVITRVGQALAGAAGHRSALGPDRRHGAAT